MKKTKFAVLLTAFMAVLGLSSCLGESDPNVTGFDYVKVTGGLGYYKFETAYGAKLTPNNQSVINLDFDTNYALIYYKYDSSVFAVNADKDIECLGIEGFKNKYLSPYTDEEELMANAPVIGLTDGYYYSTLFWDKTTMFIPVFYYVKAYNDDETKQQEELNSHNIEVYYSVNDTEANEGELILRLRHSVGDEELNSERKAIYHQVFTYNIFYALSEYKSVKGSSPKKICIEYEQNSNSGLYDENSVTSQKIEIDYSQIEGTNN
ncbi:NigD-like protein [uncultured Bacteroides sp.]|uniref:hypothetical protein n=1 Tax=Bacteroides cellulolyticus TaxID=2981780 RepID=UPI00082241B8|nr:hypothetical protein [Bacteroides cellulolyticus]MCU6770663.1 hypothetical protein [Bacteroides cellulolyticus]SCH23400.1 NigD-like protein [uncultured Bacteroides sp.]